MVRFLLFTLSILIGGASFAQLTTIPEIEGPRAAYQRALDGIRAERDKLAAPTNRTYAERLADLHTRIIDEGDTQSAEAVQKEVDRMAKGIEPTSEERRKMTGLLLALRVAYEKARGPAYLDAAKKEGQAHAAWATGLAQLEAHLTRLNQLDKVAVVKAERARVDQAAAVAKAVVTAPLPSRQPAQNSMRPWRKKSKLRLRRRKSSRPRLRANGRALPTCPRTARS